jgi:hypothetical protein
MKMLLDESTDTPPMSVIPENMRDHDPGRGWSASASIKMPTPKSGEVLIRVAAGGPLSGHHTAGGTLSAAAWDARDIGAWRFRRTVAGVGAHVIHPPGADNLSATVQPHRLAAKQTAFPNTSDLSVRNSKWRLPP